jgi:tetratricopeptide (TPR) repeat protein
VAADPTFPHTRAELAGFYSGRAVRLESRGLTREAEQEYRRVLAMREKLLAEAPDLTTVHGSLADTLHRLAGLLARTGRDEEAAPLYRRMLDIAPGNVEAMNHVAWYLATCADERFRDVSRAVTLAKKAIEQAPQRNVFWNTLGVAHYRAGVWTDAIAALERSRELLVGQYESHNLFFIAMAHWQLGHKDQARELYDRSVAWMQQHAPNDHELRRFRDEAARLLGVADP